MAGCPSWRPTNSVKALKARQPRSKGSGQRTHVPSTSAEQHPIQWSSNTISQDPEGGIRPWSFPVHYHLLIQNIFVEVNVALAQSTSSHIHNLDYNLNSLQEFKPIFFVLQKLSTRKLSFKSIHNFGVTVTHRQFAALE